MAISQALKAIAKQVPYLGIAIEVIDSVAESSEKASLLQRLSETELRLKDLENQHRQPQAVLQDLQPDFKRIIQAASGASGRTHFRIFVADDPKIWASDAIPDDHRTTVVGQQVRILAETLHYFCSNATIVVDQRLPGPDLDFVEITGWHKCLVRFDRSNLNVQQESIAHRTVKKCVDETSREMSTQIGFACGTYSPFDDFQSISMERVLEDGRIWQFEIRTAGWAGNLNYDRINNTMSLVQNQAPRSVLNYAAYQLRNIHTAPNPKDLSGQFVFFERLRLR